MLTRIHGASDMAIPHRILSSYADGGTDAACWRAEQFLETTTAQPMHSPTPRVCFAGLCAPEGTASPPSVGVSDAAFTRAPI